nr:MAG: hypothetical protein H2RhizoLitter71590_000002 [Mitovirus sp.]QDH88123.1 MAG: hypothetical protein H1Rhizo26FD12705_000002 [Mitovirus sp.]QDH91060.1 MAG: hypothetical protein H3RhizoLitter143439_000002 [Mitovirus sp.]QDH91170.1 MAG: hypothetical protein H2Bulk36424_000002 [Mitovirus sp.]
MTEAKEVFLVSNYRNIGDGNLMYNLSCSIEAATSWQ